MLRLWQAGTGEVGEWRLLLEDTRTRERRGFMDLAGLVAFLHEQIAADTPLSPHSHEDEKDHQ